MRLILSILLMSSAVFAQADGSFAPPVLGYFYDEPARKLRAIVGLPGAARAIDVEASALALDGAWPAPAADYVVAAPAGEDGLVVVRDLRGAPTVESIPGVARQFDLLAFSHGGSAAALFSAGCACVQVIAGLPSKPVLARVIERAEVTGLAISDDAATVAIASPGGVELLRENGETTGLASGRSYIAMAADGSLAVAEADAKSIRVVRPNGETHGVMSEGDGLGIPLAVAFDRNGRVVVADDAGNVHFIAADGSARATASCDCKIDRLEPAFAENLFRLAKSDAGPIWMVDAREEEARVFFVPVQRQEDAQ